MADSSYDIYTLPENTQGMNPLSGLGGSTISYDLQNKNKFINSLDPTDDQDYVTKKYLTNVIQPAWNEYVIMQAFSRPNVNAYFTAANWNVVASNLKEKIAAGATSGTFVLQPGTYRFAMNAMIATGLEHTLKVSVRNFTTNTNINATTELSLLGIMSVNFGVSESYSDTIYTSLTQATTIGFYCNQATNMNNTTDIKAIYFLIERIVDVTAVNIDLTLSKIQDSTASTVLQANSTNITSNKPIEMGANVITSSTLPTTDFQLANKQYVDQQIVGISDKIVNTQGNYLWIDTSEIISSALPLNMMNQRIKGIASPSATTDATNKFYVDSLIITKADTDHTHTLISESQTNVTCLDTTGTVDVTVQNDTVMRMGYQGYIQPYYKMRYFDYKAFDNDLDVPNKKYVDDKFATISTNKLVNSDGIVQFTGQTAGMFELKGGSDTYARLTTTPVQGFNINPYNYIKNGCVFGEVPNDFPGINYPVQIGDFYQDATTKSNQSLYTYGSVYINNARVETNKLLGNSYFEGRCSFNYDNSLNTQYTIYAVKQSNNSDGISIFTPNTIQAGYFIQTPSGSDVRIKKEIKELEVDGLDDVNLVSFKYDELKCHQMGVPEVYTDRDYIGYIAQSVPRRYVHEGENGVLFVDKQKLDAHILQYHQKTIRNLQETILKQQKQIDELKELITGLLNKQ